MTYLFQATLDKQKKAGFASLSVAEKWQWHADTYGFRRAFLDVEAHVKTSPCDPLGTWFDPARAAIAEAHYRKKFGKAPRSSGQAHLATPPPSPEDIAYVKDLLDSTIRVTADTIKRIPTKPSDLTRSAAE